MKLLQDRIVNEGKVLSGDVLKVGSFMNQMIDVALMDELGEELFRRYRDSGITKVLTVEASGIALAYATARRLGCPMVFAKKNATSNIASEVYSSPVESFTHGKTYNVMVSREYLRPDDTVLVVDDFLALGNALVGLFSIVEQSGARIAGAGIAIEKGYQRGGDLLRSRGYRIESLAIIDAMSESDGITFRQ